MTDVTGRYVGLWFSVKKSWVSWLLIKFVAQEDWTVADLQVFFHQLNILYNRLYVINDLELGTKAKLSSILSNSLSRVPDHSKLLVDYLEIHSPAKFSLKGGDKIIGQLRGLIKDIWYANRLESKRHDQEIQHQAKKNEIEISSKQAALLEQQIAIMKKAGFPDEEIQSNIRQLTGPMEKIIGVMHEREVRLLEQGKQLR